MTSSKMNKTSFTREVFPTSTSHGDKKLNNIIPLQSISLSRSDDFDDTMSSYLTNYEYLTKTHLPAPEHGGGSMFSSIEHHFQANDYLSIPTKINEHTPIGTHLIVDPTDLDISSTSISAISLTAMHPIKVKKNFKSKYHGNGYFKEKMALKSLRQSHREKRKAPKNVDTVNAEWLWTLVLGRGG
jgi:hypothetical protein